MKSSYWKIGIVVLMGALLAACGGSANARRDRFLARGKDLLKKQEFARAVLEFKNGLQVKSNDPELHYELGVAYSGTGNLNEAIKSYQRALKLNPKYFDAELRLAQLYLLTDDTGRLTEAQDRLKALLSESAGNTEVLNTLAIAELKLGHPDLAVKGLQEALVHSPGVLSTSVLLATALLSQNDVKGAESVLRKACDGDPKSSEARKVLAEFYIDRGQLPQAEEQLKSALQIDPKNLPVLMDMARLQLTEGRPQEAEENFKRLSSNLEYRSIYGVFLFGQNRRDEAVREFERVFKAYPEDRGARTNLIAAYRLTNRAADVDRLLQTALKKNRKDLDAILQWSEILIERGKLGDAETNLNGALKQNRNAPEVHYLLGKLHQAHGDTLLYRQELSEALSLNPALDTVRLELIRNYIAVNDGHSARDLVDMVPEAMRSLPMLVERNWACWLMGDLAGMRQGIDRGLALQRSPELLIQDGLWKLSTHDNTNARKSVEEALKIDPSDLRALNILKSSYVAEKNSQMALQKVQEYAASQTQSPAVQDFLGTMLAGAGQTVQARAAYAAALQADPHFTQAELALIQLDVADGKVDSAWKRLSDALARNQSNSTIRRWLGDVEVMRGNNPAAIEHFRQVVAADPSDPQALNNLAYLLSEVRNQPDEALKYAEKAVELAPQKSAYCDTLGWILYRKGLYSPAVKYLERADTSKETVVWKYHLAMAYAKSGDLARGKATLQAALKLNANVPEAKIAQQTIEASR